MIRDSCYGMPLNSWNMPSFRAIGSIWGHLIEVDEGRTLKEISFEKGRLLLATENPNRIEGKIQLVIVQGQGELKKMMWTSSKMTWTTIGLRKGI